MQFNQESETFFSHFNLEGVCSSWYLQGVCFRFSSNKITAPFWPASQKKKIIFRAARGGWSISNSGNQPLHSKFAIMVGLSSSNKTFLSVQNFLLMFSVSYNSWFFTLGNLSLSKEGSEEVKAFLLALVCKLAQKKIIIITLYDAWTV